MKNWYFLIIIKLNENWYRRSYKLTVGAIRPPKMIIPDINDTLVKYSCFNVFGVYFKRKI